MTSISILRFFSFLFAKYFMLLILARRLRVVVVVVGRGGGRGDTSRGDGGTGWEE